MTVILGIDTGGTYTDSVLIDTATRKILSKSKALTTKENLSVGIRDSIEGLESALKHEIKFISLSTTLATNAVVEGRGCRVGLILLGGAIRDAIPADIVVNVSGRMDICGRTEAELNSTEVINAAKAMNGIVDAVVISGFASVRNPRHEKKASEIVRSVLDLPIICGHELSSALGYYNRTVTSVLNAKLVPIITNLIDSTEKTLQELNISAPIMVVKGDGCLMQKEMALRRPIDTILSGPAASVMGAMFLSDCNDGIIADMGGTTLDMAYLNNGKVKISDKGAKVGEWQTCVRAVEISTFGMGGDSLITFDECGDIVVGPQRVMPICSAGEKYQALFEEITQHRKPDGWNIFQCQEIDCYVISNPNVDGDYSEEEKNIIRILSREPCNIFHIAKLLQKDADSIYFERLVKEEIIVRIGLTPTCILCAEGDYQYGSREIAQAAIRIVSEFIDMSPDEYIECAKKKILSKICACSIQSINDFEGNGIALNSDRENNFLLDCFLDKHRSNLLTAHLKMNRPLIGIGAPAGIWLKNAFRRLHTKVLLPEHGEVASAVGAAIGNIRETVDVLVRYDHTIGKYVLYCPEERVEINELDKALSYAGEVCQRYARDLCIMAGTKECSIITEEGPAVYTTATDGKKRFAEKRFTATAVGMPSYIEEQENN